MIVFEVIFFLILGVVAVVTIAAIGRPLAEAHAEKLKVQYREMGSDEKRLLVGRLEALEQEVGELRRQVAQIQETADFAVKLLQASASESGQLQLRQKQEQDG